MLLFSVYNIERGVAIYLSTKRRGCVHPLRLPSSNHCEEVLSFPDKAANLRLFYFGKEQGTSPFTTGKSYTLRGYDSILRLVTARDQVLQFFFSPYLALYNNEHFSLIILSRHFSLSICICKLLNKIYLCFGFRCRHPG